MKSLKLKKLLIYLILMGIDIHFEYFSGGTIDPKELKAAMTSLGFEAKN
jgi:Ca2+-binding EF-hand superfamily protein